ncbi:hypothetical protein [Halorubellus salinus]|uniref:hypothetical protein n=1 Tax=Halorubellus salinus TaxID=755309 RepID=UPI001D0722E1|nr:hypothetical protein [Halorubellus salinus]
MSATVEIAELPEPFLEEYVETLPAKQQRDFRAVVLEGKAQADQARERGVSQATVSINLSKAHERLQEVAEERSPTADDRAWKLDVVECVRCRGSGKHVECHDDLCYSRGFCSHGNNTCALCSGVGRVTKRLTDRWHARGSFESVEATDYDLHLQGTLQEVARQRHGREVEA